MCSSPTQNTFLMGAYVQKQVVLEDALDRFQEIGAQGQRVLKRFLPLSEELGHRLVPHALGQHSHRPGKINT